MTAGPPTAAPGGGRVLGVAPARRRRINGLSDLRSVLGMFPSGITVLTTGPPEPHGMTATSFSSASTDPPQVLCCVNRGSRMHASITAAGTFAVSVLAAEQAAVARYFADWRRPAGPAQFADIAVTTGAHTGAPLVDGAIAWIECALADAHATGDHSIFVGQVLAAATGAATGALSYFAGDFVPIHRPRGIARKEAS